MTGKGVYVYAIIPVGEKLPADVAGVGSPPGVLRLVDEGQVAAVVSDAPPQLRARRRDLMAHQESLLRLTDMGPVLPMRFGAVAPDDESVRAQLAGSQAEHLAALSRLDGGVEFNLKALPAQDALAAVVSEEKNVRRLRESVRRRPGYEANVRLGEAVAAALSRRAAEAGKKILHKLTPLARETAAGPDVHGCALNVSFLIDRSRSGAFRTTVQRFADAHRDHVELRVAGPLPCYSFVSSRPLRTPVAGG
ncbi:MULTISPECIES: GvpL/GvpF family gas vesicle protein [Streptomyces]|uniref:GvpL/GvpF family gas vesicle protein n=1 Tax=Streptomyces glycanivorans TaxID=3033808 RepID=A0ABY9J5I5_9ACTN|nr:MULTISPECIES: GvpL/GvpF family gas vesicle protein [unclassified Streptomyces]WSQ75777.1 GvpL/GvpF family gas vesicle protein [Streptomyces sp. NBC_01213]TXS15661.1 gas vesicle protein [Streptomyces sp. wa22]WLQ62269.1 GvpL/GvpF family gas vesicle protein [Streptomyces sp. Alt3]WSQ83025.1 GvpL/GvpF family gas vesicle protein [Streptomyces sp. NBC_01212]WSR10947.1 GvpL/GvpF family gas vesicle protein [Streptomyces sp. NBC_01208]